MNDTITLQRSIDYIIRKLEEAKITPQWAKFTEDIDEIIQKFIHELPNCHISCTAQTIDGTAAIFAMCTVICTDPECEKSGWHDLLVYISHVIMSAGNQAFIDKTQSN